MVFVDMDVEGRLGQAELGEKRLPFGGAIKTYEAFIEGAFWVYAQDVWAAARYLWQIDGVTQLGARMRELVHSPNMIGGGYPF